MTLRNDLSADAKIVYRWTNSNSISDRRHSNEAEEYIVEESPEVDSGIVIYGRYGDEIIANTWSNRALVKHLVTESKRLREALARLARLGNEPERGKSLGNIIAQHALEQKQ